MLAQERRRITTAANPPYELRMRACTLCIVTKF